MRRSYKDIVKLTGIALAVFLGMKYILPVVIPFFIAWVLVRFLMPGAVFLERRLHLKKVTAGGILLVLLTGAAGIALYLLGSSLIRQICNLAANFDSYMQKAEHLMKVCCSAVEKNTGIHAQAVESFIYDNMVVVEQRIHGAGRAEKFAFLSDVCAGMVGRGADRICVLYADPEGL